MAQQRRHDDHARRRKRLIDLDPDLHANLVGFWQIPVEHDIAAALDPGPAQAGVDLVEHPRPLAGEPLPCGRRRDDRYRPPLLDRHRNLIPHAPHAPSDAQTTAPPKNHGATQEPQCHSNTASGVLLPVRSHKLRRQMTSWTRRGSPEHGVAVLSAVRW